MHKNKQYTGFYVANKLCLVFFLLCLVTPIVSQHLVSLDNFTSKYLDCKVGAERTELYFPQLKNKSIAIVANQTSVINNVHLVDTLLSSGIQIKMIFAPEHGFRGDADAGEHLTNGKDRKTGLPIISLYGKHHKPSSEDLKEIDIVLFDIQDVGARFYTYISTMHYVMEACAENNIEFMVLDRPNPNGFYVDGPVQEKKFTSFVGMHPVPIVHGMTMAEYAQMINSEGWLKNGIKCKLSYVLCKNYSHADYYQLPIKPSPNLATMASVYLYPSLCLFEGTIVSVGRGTSQAFEVYGHPTMQNNTIEFTPKSIEGASKHPLYENQLCKGKYVGDFANSVIENNAQLKLTWLIDAYNNTPEKKNFFNSFFTNLAGNSSLKNQIIHGKTEEEIRAAWKKDLQQYKIIRKKYLLYQDFE